MVNRMPAPPQPEHVPAPEPDIEEEEEEAEEERTPVDPEQAAILASFNSARVQNIRALVLEETNEYIMERVVQISLEQAPTEEAGRLRMAAEQQRLTEAASREEARVAQYEEHRHQVRAQLKGQRCRAAPSTPAAMRCRQMLEERVARPKAAALHAKAENDCEAGQLRAPAVDE